jgi:DNA-binding response OmpR family regulator
MKTVMVVDDDKKIRKFLSTILKMEGFRVIEGADGTEGIDLYDSQCPDIVLADIIMPGKDGLSFIREIKSKNCNAKVVAISGGLVMTPDAYLDAAREAGADCVLPKPIGCRELVDALNNL